MIDKNNLNQAQDIFGYIITSSNKLQTFLDREFIEYDLTMKQWFILITIERFFTEPPKLLDVANILGNSYQNIKQLTLKLEKNGFVKLERDVNDKRAIRILITDKYNEFNNNFENVGMNFFAKVFNDFSKDEIGVFLYCIEKFSKALE